MKNYILFLVLFATSLFAFSQQRKAKVSGVTKNYKYYTPPVTGQNSTSTSAKPKSIEKPLKEKFLEMEKKFGTDSTARLLVKTYGFDYSKAAALNGKNDRFYENLDVMLKATSDSLNHQIARVVIRKKRDPFWINIYATNAEMQSLCAAGAFGDAHTKAYLHQIGDSLMVANVVRKIPDDKVFLYKIGRFASRERRDKIVKSLPVDSACVFLEDSKVYKSELRDFVIPNLDRIMVQRLVSYHLVSFITSEELQTTLMKKTTKELIEKYSQSDSVYEVCLFASIKDKTEYDMAGDFIVEMTDPGSEMRNRFERLWNLKKEFEK